MQMIKIFSILFLIPFLLNISINAETKIDSLENQLESASQQDQLDMLITLSKEYWNISPQKGLHYADQAAELARTLGDQEKEAKALLYGGVNAWFSGSYDLAIEYSQKSLTIAETINDKSLIAYNLNNLGMVNSSLENYEKAIAYYSRSSLIMEELGDQIEYAKIINNIGKLNCLLGNCDEALKNQLSILELVEKSGDQTFFLWLLCDIGNLYKNLGDSELARQYFSRALDLSRAIDDQVGKSIILRHLGTIALGNKDYDSARQYFSESLKLALKAATKEEIKETYKNLSEYYHAVDNDQKALEHFQLYKVYSDSLLNESKVNTIVEMETKYETESKEKENNLLRKNNEIRRLELEKQTYLRNFFIALSSISIVIIVVIYRQFHTKKRLTEILNEKNTLLEKTVHEKTDALDLNKLLLREMNHRVKNNLTVIQSLLNLQSRQIGDIESQTVLKDCVTRVKAVSRIHGILSGKVNLKEVRIVDYVRQLVEDLAANFDIDRSRIEIILNLEDIRLDMDVLVPFALILNELVTNAFKYAFADKAKGNLQISLLTNEENKIELTVKDDGLGLPEGFKIEVSESMGMEIIISLVRQIEGHLTFNSRQNQGTEFKISF